jgi:hypothetical protein
MIAEIVVELEDFRTGDNQSAQRPGDEQALVPGVKTPGAFIMTSLGLVRRSVYFLPETFPPS